MNHVVHRHDPPSTLAYGQHCEVCLVNNICVHIRPSERRCESIRKAHHMSNAREVIWDVPTAHERVRRFRFQIIVDVEGDTMETSATSLLDSRLVSSKNTARCLHIAAWKISDDRVRLSKVCRLDALSVHHRLNYLLHPVGRCPTKNLAGPGWITESLIQVRGSHQHL